MENDLQSLEANDILIGDQHTSLAELAGIDMDAVQAVRFSVLPLGAFVFKVSKPGELKTVDTDEGKRAVIEITHEVVQVNALTDKQEDPNAIVGRLHTESFFIKTADGIGRYKAYLEDSGFQGKGKLQEILVLLDGHTFEAAIGHTKSKADPDKSYANLRFAKKKK